MALSAAIAVIVAAIAPFITALLTYPGMASWLKRLTAGVVALVLGTVVAIATGQIAGAPPGLVDLLASWIVTVAIIVSLAQGYYAVFKDAAKKLEAATDYTS